MKKVIWVMGSDRKQMIEAQRQINSSGSMRALCLLSFEALQRAVVTNREEETAGSSTPSLIILDYEMAEKEGFESLSFLKKQRELAGVPLFFIVERRSEELDEECYAKGAMVILHKSFSKSEILRIENTAWQYENIKNYEKMLQKQATDLKAAKEIMRLNQQLKTRNDLLYQIFGRYFSDEVVEVILEHPQGAAIGGEKREVTVMMSDLRGFTSLSEELEPEAVTALLNFYFGKMLEAISYYHGTVIEFLGDGVLAVFGAPLSSERQTADAIAAAISMQNAMEEVADYCKQHEYPILEMGIGIHRGEAFIGNVGSEKMMRYNVIGKVVNECSRIESYSVGGQVLVSEETVEKADCSVEIANQLNIVAKGLKKPLPICEVIGIGGDYRCSIKKEETDILCQVEQHIYFQMYPLEGKKITGAFVLTRLKQCSDKRAVVKVETSQSLEKDGGLLERRLPDVYSDVEILAFGEGEQEFFRGVYAKVVERNGLVFVLRFTHVNQAFRKFSDLFFTNRKK